MLAPSHWIATVPPAITRRDSNMTKYGTIQFAIPFFAVAELKITLQVLDVDVVRGVT